MLASPSVLLPNRIIERFLLCGCLAANIIIVGIFQGSLIQSFSTISYYKDMDTLVDVDNSNLQIGTSSESNKFLFGFDDNSTLMSSLRSKVIRLKGAIKRSANHRDVCSVERYADINAILSVILKYFQIIVRLYISYA